MVSVVKGCERDVVAGSSPGKTNVMGRGLDVEVDRTVIVDWMVEVVVGSEMGVVVG